MRGHFEGMRTLSQFQELIKHVNSPGRRFVSNCFLSPEAIERYISLNKVSFYKSALGAVFLFEQSDFYSLYFNLGLPLLPGELLRLPNPGKPIMLNLLYRSGERHQEVMALEDFWISNGFEHYKKYLRFRLDLSSGDRSVGFTPKFDHERYELGYAKEEDIPAIRRLWYQELDPLSVPLPDEEQLADLIASGQIVCLHTKDGVLAAVSQPEIRGKIAYNWHSVVDVPYRGNGLINAMKSLLYLDHPEVTRFYAWMEENNQRMIEIDRRTGYIPDGLEDIQLILTPDHCRNLKIGGKST